ncbi:hypothetical protein OB919_16120 [Halobacteria archaeon AArc-curdl1]|uniref:DUF6908 domain-containing protein n=1 Tax=Natronosalvus hydrolyticus TaxID=2979988 RepID=A0AAP3E819_9EURY|nr:hypothetical protein [Halobacteria archaeon AArc-curdl1]
MKETVEQLLEAKGDTDPYEMEIGENYEFDGGEHHYNLVIEKVYDDILSVEQYYTKRMDRMSAPEVRFDISGDEWTPVEYQNHDTIPQVYEADKNGVNGLDGLLETWESNLQSQFSQYIGGDSP